jgi:hypothetical protein
MYNQGKYIQSKYAIEIVNTVPVWFNNNRIEVAFYGASGSGICLYMLTLE